MTRSSSTLDLHSDFLTFLNTLTWFLDFWASVTFPKFPASLQGLISRQVYMVSDSVYLDADIHCQQQWSTSIIKHDVRTTQKKHVHHQTKVDSTRNFLLTQMLQIPFILSPFHVFKEPLPTVVLLSFETGLYSLLKKSCLWIVTCCWLLSSRACFQNFKLLNFGNVVNLFSTHIHLFIRFLCRESPILSTLSHFHFPHFHHNHIQECSVIQAFKTYANSFVFCHNFRTSYFFRNKIVFYTTTIINCSQRNLQSIWTKLSNIIISIPI